MVLNYKVKFSTSYGQTMQHMRLFQIFFGYLKILVNPFLCGLSTSDIWGGGGRLKVSAVKEWPMRSTEATVEATINNKYCS